MDTCPICFECFEEAKDTNKRDLKSVNKSKITLKCNHSFHHDCLVDWMIREKKSINYFCPYCREKINYYIELPKGMFPIKYIHKEYNMIQKFIDSNDEKSLKEICDLYFNENHCNTILKTGKNKGLQCCKKKINGSQMCKLHSNKYSSVLSIFKSD